MSDSRLMQLRNSLSPSGSDWCEQYEVETQMRNCVAFFVGFLYLCLFCDAIHVTVNVYDAAADHDDDDDDSDSKMNIFLSIVCHCFTSAASNSCICVRSVQQGEELELGRDTLVLQGHRPAGFRCFPSPNAADPTACCQVLHILNRETSETCRNVAPRNQSFPQPCIRGRLIYKHVEKMGEK